MKLVLLDRDGVINEDREDSVKSPEELLFLPGVGEAIHRLNENNIKVAIVTNQSIVGRGIITEDELEKIHQKLYSYLERKHAKIDRIFYCADHPDQATYRRKPSPGMLIEAMTALGAYAENTVMIGDDLKDIEAAAAAKCHRILVTTGKGKKTLQNPELENFKPVNVFDSLLAAVDAITTGRLKKKD